MSSSLKWTSGGNAPVPRRSTSPEAQIEAGELQAELSPMSPSSVPRLTPTVQQKGAAQPPVVYLIVKRFLVRICCAMNLRNFFECEKLL